MIEWRTISLCAGYEVSSDGQVRRSANQRILKPQRMRDGYIKYGLSLGGRRKFLTATAHRLVALAFLGPRPSPQHGVAHNDGKRDHNEVSNLRWATQKENLADRRKHGTSCWGPDHPNRKLTAEAVEDIRERFARGEKSIRALARIHGLSKLTIADIVHNRSWVNPRVQ